MISVTVGTVICLSVLRLLSMPPNVDNKVKPVPDLRPRVTPGHFSVALFKKHSVGDTETIS